MVGGLKEGDKISFIFLQNITGVQQNMKISVKKINCAGQFIDHFIHDILDYTILRENDFNFIKSCSTFDIRESIDQIIQIQEDKILMKNIQIMTDFKGFGNHYYVNTDNKRLQQVILNLTSNAVKFTERNGSIKIKVHLIDSHLS